MPLVPGVAICMGPGPPNPINELPPPTPAWFGTVVNPVCPGIRTVPGEAGPAPVPPAPPAWVVTDVEVPPVAPAVAETSGPKEFVPGPAVTTTGPGIAGAFKYTIAVPPPPAPAS